MYVTAIVREKNKNTIPDIWLKKQIEYYLTRTSKTCCNSF